MASETVVVFLSHILTRGLVDEFERLAAAGEAHDTVFCYDNSRGDYAERLFATPPRRHLFTLDELFATGYPRKGRTRRFHPGNQDLAFIHYHRRHPGYRHYWFIEHDVRFTGSWARFFAAAGESDADLLGTTLCDRTSHPDWRFWHTVRSPAGTSADGRVRGFFPIVRLSGRALMALHEAYVEGWDGHFEGAMPTILAARGLTLEDLGGDGPYVPTGHTNRFYVNTPADRLLSPGTLVFRPRIDRPGSAADTLWHPVKQRSDRTWKFRAWRHALEVWRARRRAASETPATPHGE